MRALWKRHGFGPPSQAFKAKRLIAARSLLVAPADRNAATGVPEAAVSLDDHAVSSLAVAPDGRTAYVGELGSAQGPGGVRRFDIASRSLGARIAVAGGDVADLAVAGDGARVFATNPCPAGSCSGGAVAVIDTTTDTVASRLPLTGRIGKYTVPLQAGRLDAPGSRPVHRGHRRDRHDLPHPTQRIAAPALARAKAHQPLDTRPSTLFEHRRLPRAAHAHHPDAADQARQADDGHLCERASGSRPTAVPAFASRSARVAAPRSGTPRTTASPPAGRVRG
jgi:hypothetical protein